MLQNYFKIAARNILKNKFYVLVNIFGLGLALSCCIIAYLNWEFDKNFDAFHQNVDQLFKVNVIKASNDQPYGISPLPLGTATQDGISGIKATSRIANNSIVLKFEDKVFNERGHFVDNNFFDVFSFEILEGNSNRDC